MIAMRTMEKTLMLGKIEGKRRRGQSMRGLDGIIQSIDMSLSKLWEIVKDREAWHTLQSMGSQRDQTERLICSDCGCSLAVVSDSLQPHGLQHACLPCPSLSPRVCSNSCPLRRWCHPTVSSSVVPSPTVFNISQHQGLFHWVSSSHQVAKVLNHSSTLKIYGWWGGVNWNTYYMKKKKKDSGSSAWGLCGGAFSMNGQT